MSTLPVRIKHNWWMIRCQGAAFFGPSRQAVERRFDEWLNSNAAHTYNTTRDTDMDDFESFRRRLFRACLKGESPYPQVRPVKPKNLVSLDAHRKSKREDGNTTPPAAA